MMKWFIRLFWPKTQYVIWTRVEYFHGMPLYDYVWGFKGGRVIEVGFPTTAKKFESISEIEAWIDEYAPENQHWKLQIQKI